MDGIFGAGQNETFRAPGAPLTGGETFFFGEDGFSFWDVLDAINPLQHIPIVNTIYREITGDEIDHAPRVAGGTLYGGPIGLVGALINVASEEMTGKDVGEHAVAFFTGEETAPDGDGPVLVADGGARPAGAAVTAADIAWDDAPAVATLASLTAPVPQAAPTAPVQVAQAPAPPTPLHAAGQIGTGGTIRPINQPGVPLGHYAIAGLPAPGPASAPGQPIPQAALRPVSYTAPAAAPGQPAVTSAPGPMPTPGGTAVRTHQDAMPVWDALAPLDPNLNGPATPGGAVAPVGQGDPVAALFGPEAAAESQTFAPSQWTPDMNAAVRAFHHDLQLARLALADANRVGTGTTAK